MSEILPFLEINGDIFYTPFPVITSSPEDLDKNPTVQRVFAATCSVLLSALLLPKSTKIWQKLVYRYFSTFIFARFEICSGQRGWGQDSAQNTLL